MALMELQRLPEALKHVKKAIEEDSQYVNAHNGLAIIYSKLGQIENAKRHWEIALSIDPDHSSAKANYRRLIKYINSHRL